MREFLAQKDRMKRATFDLVDWDYVDKWWTPPGNSYIFG